MSVWSTVSNEEKLVIARLFEQFLSSTDGLMSILSWFEYDEYGLHISVLVYTTVVELDRVYFAEVAWVEVLYEAQVLVLLCLQSIAVISFCRDNFLVVLIALLMEFDSIVLSLELLNKFLQQLRSSFNAAPSCSII